MVRGSHLGFNPGVGSIGTAKGMVAKLQMRGGGAVAYWSMTPQLR